MSLTDLVKQLRQIAEEGESSIGPADHQQAFRTDPQGPQTHPAGPLPAGPLPAEPHTLPAETLPAGSPHHPSTTTAALTPAGSPSSSRVWGLLAVVIGVLLSVAGAVFFWLRGKREPGAAPITEQPQQQQLPLAIRQRAEAVAARRAEYERQQRLRARQQSMDFDAEDSEGEQTPLQQQPARRVRFDEEVTEYPIPARAISRRANAEMRTPSDQDMPAAAAPIPQIHIDSSQRFEG